MPHPRQPIFAPNGAVATSQPLAAAAGLSVLRRGGNAVDAALATAATLTVVQPGSNDIGGDLFAIVPGRRTAARTVRNLGPGLLPYEVRLDLPGGLTLVRPDDCEVANFRAGGTGVSCGYPAFDRSGSRTIVFEFSTPRAVDSDILPMAHVQPDGWGDSDQDNNSTEFGEEGALHLQKTLCGGPS